MEENTNLPISTAEIFKKDPTDPSIDKNGFAQLPVEILLKICDKLPPEDISNVAQTSRKSHNIIFDNELWKKKFALHFPEFYEELSTNVSGPINWHTEFFKAYQYTYQGIPSKIRKLFSLLKENQTPFSIAIKVKYLLHDHRYFLDIRTASGQTLVDIAREKNNQDALNDFYKITCDHYSAIFGYNRKYLITYAICCRQNYQTIASLLKTSTFIKGRLPIDYFFGLAAQMGNLDAIQALMAHDPNLITVAAKALLKAVREGHTAIVRYLLSKQSPIHKAALCWAAVHGYTEIVKLLITENINLKVTVQFRNTNTQMEPIHLAAWKGHLEIVKILLDKDKNLISSVDEFNQTPLMYAADHGHLAIVSYLLEQSEESLKIVTNDGQGVFHAAAAGGNLDVVKILIARDKALISSVSSSGQTPLLYAAVQGHLAIVSYLLEQNEESLKIVTNDGRRVLHGAATGGNLDVVKILLDKDQTLIDAVDELNQTPLLYAAAKGHTTIVEYLLSLKGKNQLELATNQPSNVKDHGKTPLYWAVECNHTKAAISLIRAGANLKVEVGGKQPIHLAAKKGNLELVKALIEADPDLTYKLDAKNRSPWMLAEKNNHPEVAKYLTATLVTNAKNLCGQLQTMPEEKYSAFFGERQQAIKEMLKIKGVIPTIMAILSNQNFKAFLASTIHLNMLTLDQMIPFKSKMAIWQAETKNENENTRFIKEVLAPFTPDRRKIEALIADLKKKGQQICTEEQAETEKVITISTLADQLLTQSNTFFAQPSPENAKTFLEQCENFAHAAEDIINSPRSPKIWRDVTKRDIHKILLIASHIFLITIPLVWGLSASRNLLLGKTESQAKVNDVIESVDKLNTKIIAGTFQPIFAKDPASSKVDEIKFSEDLEYCLTPIK